MNSKLGSIVAAAHQASQGLSDRSGSIFYSGQLAFSSPCTIYILGLNPGGSPQLQAQETIGRDLMEWSQRPKSWSRYVDEAWRGRQPGTHGMQPRIRHMFDGLGLDLRQIPASNVVFVRTNSEADLRLEANDLLSNAHVSADGIAVVTLTHPGRADWCNPQTDPTPLVQSVPNRI